MDSTYRWQIWLHNNLIFDGQFINQPFFYFIKIIFRPQITSIILILDII